MITLLDQEVEFNINRRQCTVLTNGTWYTDDSGRKIRYGVAITRNGCYFAFQGEHSTEWQAHPIDYKSDLENRMQWLQDMNKSVKGWSKQRVLQMTDNIYGKMTVGVVEGGQAHLHNVHPALNVVGAFPHLHPQFQESVELLLLDDQDVPFLTGL